MKIAVFLHGTTIMHKNAVGLTREEIIRQVINGDESVYDQASYIPIGNAAKKLQTWKKQGAEIIYLSPLSESKDIRKDEKVSRKDFKLEKKVLKRYGFPKGKIYHREKDEQYKDVAERIVPDVLIEDDCESIGGEKEMTITFVKPEIKQRIKSIIVKEFRGIDHLPNNINSLLS